MKQYSVEILSKKSRGTWGKCHYTNWCLSGTSKSNAQSFAEEIIAGMTWREILAEKYKEEWNMKIHMPSESQLDDVIGYANASNYFSYRAEVAK